MKGIAFGFKQRRIICVFSIYLFQNQTTKGEDVLDNIKHVDIRD